MSASGSKSVPSVGFLTVQEFTDLGLIGGYLILNAVGRPLEFHCTAPVRPNRAQEILYGPTLAPFLYGEQIGLTFRERLRETLRFDGMDDLMVQMRQDEARTREVLGLSAAG